MAQFNGKVAFVTGGGSGIGRETALLSSAGFVEGSDIYNTIAGMHPIKRMGRPSEIAEAVVWLCSDQASFVTGTTLLVDGGYTAQ